MKNKKIILPPLPFGEWNCVINSDVKKFSDKMATIVTSLKYYDAIGDKNLFLSKTYTLQNSEFKVVASANTSVIIDVDNTKDITLMIPFFGENISNVEKDSFKWRAKESAILLPNTGRAGSSSTRATITIDINPIKITKIAKVMLGLKEEDYLDLNLFQPRLISLKYGNISFEEIFKSLAQIINSYKCNTDLLWKIGIDELFYRNIIMMLLPEKFFSDNSFDKVVSPKAIDKIIEFQKSHPFELLTLNDLEKISGLSCRALQYEFKKRLGLSPMQWLKKERLNKARELLLNKNSEDTITTIAMNFGFASSSLFSKYYYEEFGELPSHTIKSKFGIVI